MFSHVQVYDVFLVVLQEFMVGKTAAHYIRPYHSLYHFKYNLYKRCLAKVRTPGIIHLVISDSPIFFS